MTIKLKSCPFCGKNSLRIIGATKGNLWICCNTCHTESGIAPNAEILAEMWNTRIANNEEREYEVNG